MSSAVVKQSSGRSAKISVARLTDYWQLTKPRIAIMAMSAVAVGYILGGRGTFQAWEMASACLGIFVVAVSCSLLNQCIEKDTDARMERTADRPVATGRVRLGEALAAGLVTGLLGITWLWLTVNVLTAGLAAATLAVYVCAYTPMKRKSPCCTTIGAFAGALPPVLGWTAAGSPLDAGALALFLLLFVWQFPHFLAIATIYRRDYERAGLKMLPVLSSGRSCAGLISVISAAVLIPFSLLAWHQGLTGDSYVLVAALAGSMYLLCSVRFVLEQSRRRAHELFLCSIVYLPTVLLTMIWEHCCLTA